MMKKESEKASENIVSFEGRRQRVMEIGEQDVEVLSMRNLCPHFRDLHPKTVMVQTTCAGFLLQHGCRPHPSTSATFRNQSLVQE